eukprot:s21_g11.t1
MATMAMSISLMLSLAAVGAVRSSRDAVDPEWHQWQRDEPVDCSERKESRTELDLVEMSTGFPGLSAKLIVVEGKRFYTSDGEKTYFFMKGKPSFVAPYLVGGIPSTLGPVCAVGPKKGTPQFCEAKNGTEFWNEWAERANAICKGELCKLARTGKWKNGLWKQEPAKKTPWERTMPGHKSMGYEDAFMSKCVREPTEFPTAFGGMLGDFEDFAKHFNLITSKLTFNKKVCGCDTEDDCSQFKE